MIDMGTWRCHVCGRLRPDAVIAVWKNDRSVLLGLPAGSYVENVRYCIDDPICLAGAKVFSFTGRPQPSTDQPSRSFWDRLFGRKR